MEPPRHTIGQSDEDGNACLPRLQRAGCGTRAGNLTNGTLGFSCPRQDTVAVMKGGLNLVYHIGFCSNGKVTDDVSQLTHSVFLSFWKKGNP